MTNKDLKELAYYKTGGTAREILCPTSTSEVATILKRLHAERSDYFYLGRGSNSLVMDEPFEGSVISFHKLTPIKFEGDRITAGSGVENTALAQFAYDNSIEGLAWMYRLPGQLGATVRMNARCYGGEISGVVTMIEAVTKEGEIKSYESCDNRRIFRGYKDTAFMTNGEAITAITFKATPGVRDDILKAMQYCEQDRLAKKQFDHPSCGCVFKNHHEIGVPSGMLLQAAGAKEMSTKTLEINPLHANFVFNKGATSRQILELTLKMRAAVYEKFGVFMAYEMELLGTVPADLKGEIFAIKKHKPNKIALAPLVEAFKQC